MGIVEKIIKSSARVCFGILLLTHFNLSATPLLGDKAPVFQATSTDGKINFPDDCKGSWVILFSFPSVFTPVCTEEMVKFMVLGKEFFNVKIIGISANRMEDHKTWLQNILRNLNIQMGQACPIALISDENKSIASLYGMLHTINSRKLVRSVFFIDPSGIVRAMFFYPMQNGRGVKEIKRMLQAMQASDESGGVTLPDWEFGDNVMMCKPCGENLLR